MHRGAIDREGTGARRAQRLYRMTDSSMVTETKALETSRAVYASARRFSDSRARSYSFLRTDIIVFHSPPRNLASGEPEARAFDSR